MLFTQEQLEKRINSNDNVVNGAPEIEVHKWKGAEGGRGNATAIPHEERVAIGVIANTLGQSAAVEIFDRSQASVSHIARGEVYKREDEKLKEEIEARVKTVEEQASEKAAERLLTALQLISDDKLANASAKDASVIASNLSKVALNMKGGRQDSGNRGPSVKIVLNQPKPASESHFDSIEVTS